MTIEFNYVNMKTPAMKSYYRGYFLYETKQILDSITIYTKSIRHSSYGFEYDEVKKRSVLKKIHYCGSDSVSTCFAPLKITYENELDAQINYTSVKNYDKGCSGMENAYSRTLIDMNGDGLLDVAGIISQSLFVSLSHQGDYFEAASEWLKINVGTTQLDFSKGIVKIVDLNSDGFADLFLVASDGAYVSLNNGQDSKSMGPLKK